MTTKSAGFAAKMGLAVAFLLAIVGSEVGLRQELHAQEQPWWVKEYNFKPAAVEKTTAEKSEAGQPDQPAPPTNEKSADEKPLEPGALEKPVSQPETLPPPAIPSAPMKAPDMVPSDWEREGLDELDWGRVSGVRISVLNGSDNPLQGGMVTALLNNYHRKTLEQKIGQEVVVVNASRIAANQVKYSAVYYRPGFLKAAMLVAAVVPGQQLVAPMRLQGKGKIGIDLEIQLGRDFP